MGHINYYFQRDKNKYEKVWDYNKRATKFISFITNWFWITDVTELTSHKRECSKGLNDVYIILSLICVCLLLGKDYIWEYSAYFKVAAILNLVLLGCYPLLKFMFKLAGYFLFYYFFIMQIIYPDLSYGLFNYLIVYVLFILPGIYYNMVYLDRVKSYKGFELTKVEVNKMSAYYWYLKLLKKQDIKLLEGVIKNEFK